MYNSGVGIVTKNCERYIQEVCCYNHLIGFNKIYICLNDCEDSTYQRIYKLPDVVLNKVEVCNTKDLSGGGGG